MQPVRSHICGLSGIRAERDGRHDRDPSAGVGLYCGGYASPSGRPGHHGADVPGGVLPGIYRLVSDSVYAGEQGTEFLFPADRESGSCAGEPVCTGSEETAGAERMKLQMGRVCVGRPH